MARVPEYGTAILSAAAMCVSSPAAASFNGEMCSNASGTVRYVSSGPEQGLSLAIVSYSDRYAPLERVPLDRVTISVEGRTLLEETTENTCDAGAGPVGFERRRVVVAKDVVIDLSGGAEFPLDMAGTGEDRQRLRAVLICVEDSDGMIFCPASGD